MDVNERQARSLLNKGLLSNQQVERLYSQLRNPTGHDFLGLVAEQAVLPADVVNAVRQQVDRELRSQVAQDLQGLLSRDRWFKPHAEYLWEQREKLGEGGMGAVYRVRDQCLGRFGALKRVTTDSDDAVKRFLREVTITARLDHPSIPPVFEAGVMGSGQHYMVMKVVEGETLKEKMEACHAEGELSPRHRRELLQVFLKVCEAVGYAHSQGVLHRDLKPENIMIGRFGEVLVLDWGVAKDLGDHEMPSDKLIGRTLSDHEQKEVGLTFAGAFVGTPGYMAPEQLAGRGCKQSDVYSLGLILTEILTNRPAIAGQSAIEKLSATASGTASSPRALNKNAPEELDSLVQKALQFKISDRLASVESLATELNNYLAGEALSVHRYTVKERFYRWAAKHPGFLLSSVFFLLLISSTLFFVRAFQRSEQVKNEALELADDARASEERLKRAVLDFRQLELDAQRGLPRAQLIAKIDEALEKGGGSYELLLAAAKVCRLGQLVDKEKRLLTRASEQFPPAYSALFLLHEIELKESGQSLFYLTPSLKLLAQRAKERKEENEFTLMVDAFALFQKKELNAALVLLNDLEKYSTSFSLAYCARGVIKGELGDIDGAVVDFNKAIDCNKNNADAFHNRALTKLAQGFNKEAIEDFDAALALDRFNPKMYYNRGRAKRRLDDLEGAIEDLSRAIQYDRDYAKAYSTRGLVKERLGRKAEALEDYNKALSFDPGHAPGYFHRGVLRLKAEQLKSAEGDFLKGLQFNPNDSRAYYNLGVIRQKQKRGAEAFNAYTKALELNPEMASAHYALATLWEDRKNLTKAFDHYSKALEIDPRMPHALYKTGYIHGVNRRYKEALVDFTKTIDLMPTYPGVYKNRGVILVKMKKFREAALDFELHLSKSPTDKSGQQLRDFILKHLGRRSKY